MSKYIKGDYTAVVEHSIKTCAINLYIQNTKLGCGLIIPRITKVGTEYHTTTHSNLFGAKTETDKRGIYDEQKIFDELTELGKNIVDFMAFCDCQKNIKGTGYGESFIDEAKLCKAVELPKPELMDYNPVKQYLKWEDLEFKEEEQTIKVLLNGKEYKLSYFTDGIYKFIDLLTDNGKYQMGRYVDCYSYNVQFFNDLRLERVEE